MTITVKVGSAGAGRDYATIQAAWNALPATLTDHYVFELYNDSEFTAGLDTSASAKTMAGFTVTIQPAAGQGFRDHANKLTNALRYNQANGVAVTSSGSLDATFNIKTNGIILDGLQIKQTASSGWAVNDSLGSTLTVGPVVKNCLLQSSHNASAVLYSGYGQTALNNVIIQTNSSGNGVYLGNGGKCKGNTIVYVGTGTSSGKGAFAEWASVTAIDNVAIGFAAAFASASGGSYSASSDYNATDLASIGTGQGTHNVVSLTATDQFQAGLTSEASIDLRVKAGAALIGAGVADADIPTDILGQTRGTPPGIGAAEYGVSAPTITLTPDPSAVPIGTNQTITITRSVAAPVGGVTYNLASDTPATATVPATATILEGNTSVTFTATSVGIGTTTITATNAADSGETDSLVHNVTTVLVKKAKFVVHSDFQNATNITIDVFQAPGAGALTGARLGAASGINAEATLEGGQAVIKVPATSIGATGLSVGTSVRAVFKGTTSASSPLGNAVEGGSVATATGSIIEE